MLTPSPNPMLTGTVCVVKGSVEVGDPIPHQEGDPAVAISYGVAPAETVLAPEPDAIVVEVYYPGYENFKKRWEFSGAQGLSGSFYWDGLLDLYDDYGNLVFSDVGYCPCSTVFARITVKVRDRYWTIYGIQEPIREWTWEMPRISIVQPHWDSLFMVTDPAEMILMASPSVTAPVSNAQWSGGEDPPTGGGASFTTAFRQNLGDQWITATVVEAVSGQTVLTRQRLRIWGITELEWIQWPNGGVIEGGQDGLIIFPEYTVEDMQTGTRPDRRRVLLLARLNIAKKDIPVYFGLIDVDDPSTATGPIDGKDDDRDAAGIPIDEDGDGLNIDGGDNKGDCSWQGLGTGEDCSVEDGIPCVTTNSQGYAGILIDVSLKPGDNYRGVAATIRPTIFRIKSGLYGGVPDGEPTVYYVHNGQQLFFPDWPERHVKATEQNLTVWRKLHCECDTMAEVLPADNHFSGKVTRIDSAPVSKIYLERYNSPTDEGPQGRFQNGRLIYGNEYVSLGWSARDATGFYVSTASSIDHLHLVTEPPEQRSVVQIYDDDYQFIGVSPQPSGLPGEVPHAEAASSYYERAFIKVVSDGAGAINGNGSVYTKEVYSVLPPDEYSSRRQSQGNGLTMFWIAYAVANYQPREFMAFDPNDGPLNTSGEALTAGRSTRPGVWIYRECLRDASENEGFVIAHELGHLFGFENWALKGNIRACSGPDPQNPALMVVEIPEPIPEGANVIEGEFQSDSCSGRLNSYSNLQTGGAKVWVESTDPAQPGQEYQIWGNDIMSGKRGAGFSPWQLESLRRNEVSPIP